MEEKAEVKTEVAEKPLYTQRVKMPEHLLKTLDTVFRQLQQQSYKLTVGLATETVHFKAVDVAHVSLAELSIPLKLLEGWDVKQADSLYIPEGMLTEILSLPGEGKTIEFSATRCANKTMVNVLTIASNSNGRITQSKVIDEPRTPSVPNLSFLVQFAVSTATLQKAVKFLLRNADHLHFEAEAVSGLVKASTVKTTKMESIEGDYYLGTVTLPGGMTRVKSYFPGDYTMDVVKSFDPAIFPSVTVHLNNDLPMKVVGVSQDGIVLSRLIAPRIEND